MKKAAPQYQQSSRAHGKFTPATAESSVWMKHDREFFRRNPRYSHHLRRLMPGELKHAHACSGCRTPWTHAIVRQLAPGHRVRFFLEWADLPDGFPHWETFFSLIWETRGRSSTKSLMEKAREIDRAAAACAGAEVLQ
jgi:hypothetical protein